MTLSQAYLLANDSEFRVLAGFTSPPRAATVTALEPSGQLRLALDDADGADVLAWPLNGFVYGVGDVVYVLFAANSPESAIVLGAKAPLPTLDGAVFAHDHVDYLARDGSTPLTADWDIGDGRKLSAATLAARDDNGLVVQDNAGNTGATFHDGGGRATFGAGSAPLWGNAYDVIQVGLASAFVGHKSAVSTYFSSNAYFDGSSWRRKTAAPASLFLTASGAASILVAATGAADSVITWTTGWSISAAGRVGNVTQQGQLHLHDGVGGLLFVTKTGIDGTAQTILPNGSGDITRGLAYLIVVTDGSTGGAATNVLFPGGNQDIAVGTLTVRLSCAADGSLTVKRQSGTGTATVALVGVWL